MPKLTDNMETQSIAGTNFGFSATRIENLGATEYTLVTIVADRSGSVGGFYREIEKALKEIVRACRRSPRADNLMLRVVSFDDDLTEVHGFRPLPDVNENDYDNCLAPGGQTALFDATESSIRAMAQYGEQLVKNDFSVNGALFVLTDGGDNVSKSTVTSVKTALEDVTRKEMMESLMSVLIGVNTQYSGVSGYLQNFQIQGGLMQYVDIAGADEKTLAKLGAFVSKSISSQSQSLGTGGPSKTLTF